MRRGLVWFCGAGLLALGCSDDSTVPIDDDSSTGTPMGTTTTVVDPTTGGDPSATSSPDSSDGTTAEPGSDTAMVESSTGPVTACGNDVIEDEEVCDGTDLGAEDCATQGFDDGDLACAADCSGYDTRGCVNYNCGNGVIEGTEACDGVDLGGATCQTEGFDSGTVSCQLGCGAIDTSDCGTCGNVIVDGDEVCDDIVLFGQTCVSQGYSSGQLGCSPDCLTYDYANCIQCGNDIIDGVEPCDGVDLGGETCQTQGFVGGVLACEDECGAFDISGCNACGNDIIDAGEGCDGMNLGGQTCASLGLIGGNLTCSASCQYDFSGCDIPGVPFGSDTGYTGYVIQGAPLPCDDIVATGTPTLLSDDSQIVVPIGFTFPMYGANFTNVTIQSNGALHFDTNTYMTLGNTCVPTATNPQANNLYVIWDDLNPGLAGPSEVYYQTLGPVGNRRFVAQWETAYFGGDANDLIRVQAMLDELSGQITVCYVDTINAGSARNNGAQATSGIQQNSVNGFQYSCNTPDLINGTQLLYIPF
ncbi:hypothetical protein [Paraliomyxa miuraensis]|uniref:hypothetical protein n=1 Tax=Paraliomyxa miuraensis TaxID=376150 RepID=UPI002256432B|nr:hypothetical protein [Paraliomyxa miuraensis]MCX4247657.1 hypothetical protein [Paraliomyxa miuraensis]